MADISSVGSSSTSSSTSSSYSTTSKTTSGVGTSSISGIVSQMDTRGIVDSLMNIERAPLRNMEARKTIETQKLNTWKSIQAKLLNVKIQSLILNREFTFKESSAVSSNESIVKIASTSVADPVTQSIKVTRLAAAQQTLSRGVASKTSALMASGEITIKAGNGTDDQDVNAYTPLSALNGGTGVDTTHSIALFNRRGASVTVDLSGAEDMQDVIDTINNAAAAINITAAVSKDGNGLVLRDSSGGAGTLSVSEMGGTTAAGLGLLKSAQADELNGGDLDPVYKISIDSSNNTLEGIRDTINEMNGPFTASIVSTGSATNPYKLSITGKNTGVIGALQFTESSAAVTDEAVGTGDGTKGAAAGDYALDYVPASLSAVTGITVGGVAYDVRAAGARTGTGNEVEIDLATGKLQFFTDGTAANVSGEIKATYTPQDLDLDLAAGAGRTVQNAQDARIELGTDNPEVVERHTNKVNDLIPGVALDLVKASDEVVTIDVKSDVEGIKKSISDFITAYNDVMDLIRTQGKYDAETQKKGGPLFGDTTLILVQQELERSITGEVAGLPSNMRSIFQVGVTADISTGKLTVDDAKLTDALTYNLSDVMNLFTRKSNVALAASGTSVAALPGTEAGYSPNTLIDGNVSSQNFGAGEGWMGSSALGTDTLTFTFDRTRTLSKFVVRTLDSLSNPASSWGVKDYTIQYLKLGGIAARDADWITATSVSGNVKGEITSYLTNVTTDQVRLRITGTNAADGKARLTEVETYEDVGLAGRMNNILTSLTDTNTGIIAFSQNAINDQISDYDDRMKQLEDRLSAKEARLLKQFTAMEKYMGQMQGTSSWLNSQMNQLSANSNASK